MAGMSRVGKWVLIPALVASGCMANREATRREVSVEELERSRWVNDPAECLDLKPDDIGEIAHWDATVEAEVSERLPSLAECLPETGVAPSTISISLLFRNDGTQPSRSVLRTKLNDCSVAQCISSHFATLRAPAFVDRLGETPPGTPVERRHTFTLVVASEQPARRASASEIANRARLKEELACRDGEPPAEPKLPPEVIQSEVRSHYSALQSCYLVALARNNAASGRVEFRFKIGNGGRVEWVKVQSNALPDCDAVACMRSAFEGMKFPKPTDGTVTVVYPIMFVPR
jgi:hypothetical protein